MPDRFRPDAALLPLMPLELRAEFPEERGPMKVPLGEGVILDLPCARITHGPVIGEPGYVTLPLRWEPSLIEQLDDERDEDEADDGFDDCSMGPDGQCGQAGSEYCDFECPTMRDHVRFLDE